MLKVIVLNAEIHSYYTKWLAPAPNTIGSNILKDFSVSRLNICGSVRCTICNDLPTCMLVDEIFLSKSSINVRHSRMVSVSHIAITYIY